MTKVSVIMPCYNAASFLEHGVASVLGQTFQDLELIVVDDGSTDESSEILRRVDDPRLKMVFQRNMGVSSARNRGLAEARGEFVAFLDADDTWHPDFLGKLAAALDANPEAVLAYCGWQNVGLPGGRGKPHVPPDYEGVNKIDFFLRCCPWPIHAALTRRSAIEAAGRFDERFTHAEDYGLWLKIAVYARIFRVPEVLAFYHFHGEGQASGNGAVAALAHWKVQREFLGHHEEVVLRLGRKKIKELTDGYLLERGFECYWRRDLEAARRIFRTVLRLRYFGLSDLKYLLPSLLPLSVHRFMVAERKKYGK